MYINESKCGVLIKLLPRKVFFIVLGRTPMGALAEKGMFYVAADALKVL